MCLSIAIMENTLFGLFFISFLFFFLFPVESKRSSCHTHTHTRIQVTSDFMHFMHNRPTHATMHKSRTSRVIRRPTPPHSPARYQGTYRCVPRITSSRQNVHPKRAQKSKTLRYQHLYSDPYPAHGKSAKLWPRSVRIGPSSSSPSKRASSTFPSFSPFSSHLPAPSFFAKSYFKHKKKAN
ncbi:hypothetical protein GGI35DRAFT_66110 [Trichoderma velutinum]